MTRIAPSILSADFARLAEQVREAEAAGADQIHIDVMDGHFVPNITMGALVVDALRPVTRLPLDVHLMIETPERFLADFARAGADLIQVHVEATPHVHRAIGAVRELGCQAGVVLNPGTPLDAILEVLPDADVAMVMTVNPGFGGQAFIESQLAKIERLRAIIDSRGYRAAVEIDGGVHSGTAPLCVRAGADILVAGSAVFNRRQSVAEAMAELRASVAGVPRGPGAGQPGAA